MNRASACPKCGNAKPVEMHLCFFCRDGVLEIRAKAPTEAEMNRESAADRERRKAMKEREARKRQNRNYW